MTTEASATTPVPAAAATPPAPPASATTDPPAPKPGEVGTPEWLNPRLEQAKRAGRSEVLKDLGVDDVAVAKKALADVQARADAEKTAFERLDTERKAREKAEKELETARAALSARADAELASLSSAQQAFVEKAAGNDPAKRLATIADVRALVAATAPSAPPVPASPPVPEARPSPAPEQRRALPAPASTAAPGAAPAGAPVAPVDHLANLERLDRSNPIAAGAYYARHRRAIDHARSQKDRGTPAS
jgi:hypothetical protein